VLKLFLRAQSCSPPPNWSRNTLVSCPPPILFHRAYFFMEKYGIKHHTSKNCGQPYGHFFSPPSCSQPKPLRPLTSNNHGSRTVVVCCQIWPRLPTVHIVAANRPSLSPPNRLCAAHVPTAFPHAAVGTELPDDADRSVGKTY